MPADVNFLTVMLEQFKGAIGGAFAFLSGDVRGFLGIAAAFAWSLAVGLWIVEGCPGRHVPILRKFMLVVAVAWLVEVLPRQAVPLMEAAANTGRGMVPAGSSFDLSDPGEIAAFGLVVGDPLLRSLNASAGFVDTLINLPDMFFMLVAWVAVVLTFVVIALCVFFTWVEWGLLSAAVYLLLPLAVLGPTNFAAERAVGYVAATAVKFLVLGGVVTFSGLFLAGIEFADPSNPNIWECVGVMTICLGCLAASLRAPAAAAGLVNGGPVLGAAEGVRMIAQAASVAMIGGGIAAGAAGAGTALAGRGAVAARMPGGHAVERLGQRVKHAGTNAARFGAGYRHAARPTGEAPMSASQRRTLDGIAARTGRAYDRNMTHDQAAREIRRLLGRDAPGAQPSPPAGWGGGGSSWDGPPTDRQLAVLRQHGVDPGSMTRGQASARIQGLGYDESWWHGDGRRAAGK